MTAYTRRIPRDQQPNTRILKNLRSQVGLARRCPIALPNEPGTSAVSNEAVNGRKELCGYERLCRCLGLSDA